MPRRAHCVFHRERLLKAASQHKVVCFNAPKGSLCISPEKTKMEKTKAEVFAFQCPEGLIVYFTKTAGVYVTKINKMFQCPEGLIVYFTPRP
jgi:hypothetical protein